MFLLEKVRKKYTVFRNYRLTGNLNPDKTFETPELSGLTRSDCIHLRKKIRRSENTYI